MIFSLPDGIISIPEILRFVNTVDCYTNISIAYRILLIVPVTVASAERSFSKLKLLNNYLRSTVLLMTLHQEMLERVSLLRNKHHCGWSHVA
jgi:hypothetical protein